MQPPHNHLAIQTANLAHHNRARSLRQATKPGKLGQHEAKRIPQLDEKSLTERAVMRLALSLPGVKLAYCGHSIPISTVPMRA